MTADYPVDEVPATPEYVLDVLRDWHSQLVAVNQADPALRITTETTVDEFADGFVEPNWESCDWTTVADTLAYIWELSISKAEWRPVLTPGHSKMLGDVARFLARRVRRLVVRPWRHCAGDCLPAGCFLTVRALLAASGDNPDAITPSTPLSVFVTRYREDFFRRLTRLAPCRLPPLHFRPYHWSGRGMTGVGFLLLLLASLCLLHGPRAAAWPYGFGAVLFVTGSLLSRTRRVEWPGLVTFRDLAYALAGQQPRRRIQPTP